MLVGFMAFYSLLMSILGGKVSFISMVLNPDCIFSLFETLKRKIENRCPGLLSREFNLVSLYYIQGICAPGNSDT